MISALGKLRCLIPANVLGTLLIALGLALPCAGQANGNLFGKITDPTGAVIPGASISVNASGTSKATTTGPDGTYSLSGLPPGDYQVTAVAPGFGASSINDVTISGGHARELNLSLTIAVQRQQVTVGESSSTVDVSSSNNANATVLTGNDLNAFSDDPDALQSELQALAGPSAGPAGGQIYIDGFTGGQLPPKATIKEIRVNQEPFSAEYDRLGYGRIEIVTKPGSQKLSGHLGGSYLNSALDTTNPLVTSQPNYHFYWVDGDIRGPLTRNSSYAFEVFDFQKENQSVVNAVNPANTSSTINEAVPAPSSILVITPRYDFQLGSSHTLSVRDFFYRSLQTASGVGTLSLPEQASNINDKENTVQISDSWVVNSHMVDDMRFRWRRIRNSQLPDDFTPTVTVQGAFTTGGSSSGTVQDHQDLCEFQDYVTDAIGQHTITFGARLRSYRDANFSTSGANGSYSFSSVAQYHAATPYLYTQTIISNPLARLLLFDGALFYQDDWRWKPNLTLSYGLRFEGQNRIRDHADWAPRLALAWAPQRANRSAAKTVLRAGYGWFYQRFAVPNPFTSSSGVPYIVQAIHNNGTDQEGYIISNPGFYNPNEAVTPGELASSSSAIPYINSINPHFKAAIDMQGTVGIDQQVGKVTTINVSYFYTRGIHQYLSNNISAPTFDASRYLVTGTTPSLYNYQFQSGGLYKENQIVVTASTKAQALSLHATYTYTNAHSDTQGVTYFPSLAQDPNFDYGRASFGMTNQMSLLATYTAPYKIVISPMVFAQSGVPYNITIGNDLTENNQSNARPTFGMCGAAGVVQTHYGCLDIDPIGKGEKIIPYNLGIGPSNFTVNLRVSRSLQLGTERSGPAGPTADGNVATTTPRSYLSLTGGVINLFNNVNLASPNGVLSSSLFGKSQSLATGQFASPSPGNRTIYLTATLNF